MGERVGTQGHTIGRRGRRVSNRVIEVEGKRPHAGLPIGLPRGPA